MRKERILHELKDELIQKIEGLTFENAEDIHTDIQEFIGVIKWLGKLSFEIPQERFHDNGTQDERTQEKEPIIEANLEPDSDTTDELKEDKPPELTDEGIIGKTFRFQRNLSGGIIQDLDNGYFLLEKMVRDMTLEDGDIVKVTGEEIVNEQPKYSFEIFEKSKTINKDRIEIPFCKVDTEAGEYVIKECLSGLIRLDEVPFTLIIQEKDRQRLRLKKDDIVDIAFYKNNPSTVRVIWRHDVKAGYTPTQEERKLYSEHRNDKSSMNEKTEKDYPIDEKLFRDRKVLIIGGENRHADYKRAFDSLNIEVEMIKGREESKRLKAAIDRADIVAIIIGEAKHRASIVAVQHCKDTEKPFESTYENGIQSVLLCAEQAIKKGIEQELIEHVS